jgi:hypothetical protein
MQREQSHTVREYRDARSHSDRDFFAGQPGKPAAEDLAAALAQARVQARDPIEPDAYVLAV